MTCQKPFCVRVIPQAVALLLLALLVSCGGGSSPSTGVPSSVVVTSISPNTVQAGAGNTTLTVSGANFVSSSVVTFNGQSLTTTYSSATLLTATIPASDLTSGKTVQIGVSNPNAAPSTTVAFQIDNPVPVLTAITPGSVALSSSATITLSGSGFVPTSTIVFNSASRIPTYVNGTTIQMSLSATDLAAAGNDTITVVNAAPAGGTSQPATLQVTQLIPTLSSVSPASIQSSVGNVAITLKGDNFGPTAVVQADGTSLSITSQNSANIVATLPAAIVSQTGAVNLVVTNPGTNAESSGPMTIQIVGTPTIGSPTPAAAAVGSPDLTITLYGSNLLPGSVVQWNGQPLATQYANFQLTATIPAIDLASFTNGSLTVATPIEYPATTLVSAPQAFTTYLALANDDIVYSPHDSVLYASVPASVMGSLGNCIVGIDPITGNLMRQIPVGSQPNKIAISDDGSQLFVGLDGAGAVRQVNLTTRQAGQQFSLGGGPGVYNPPFTAAALAVLPGEPNSVAVFSSDGIVTIYDSGVARPKDSSGLINTYFDQNYGALTFGATASTLYVSAAPFQGVEKFTVDSTGITGATSFPVGSGANGVNIQYDNGRLYLGSGIVLDANTGTQLGTFSAGTNQTASGPIVSDSTLNLAFVGYTPFTSSSAEVLAFYESTFNSSGTINVTGVNGNFQEISRWGQNGLAVAAPLQIYVLQSSVVKDLSSSPADVSVALTVPANAGTGSAISYTATIKNQGPNQAQGVNFVSTVPDTVIVNSVIASAGTCGAGSEAVCNLGNLASGSTATVTLNLTPTTSGTIESTATVSSVSYDPTSSNNQATASTIISGGLYSAKPVLTGISPNIVQAGSGAVTLTVTGTGFNASSTVKVNGTALATTYVSSSELTANVTPSLVANYGWEPVTVSNPAPGGGSSLVLPLTIYSVVNLLANDILFDPFTRQIYATVPSASTPLTGNSVAALDPVTGNLGTPIIVGSEPNVMAETSDGKYLYVGLSGANSLARFNLVTQTLEATYPLTISQPVAATWLSTMPGNDNTLAIDTSSNGTVGIFDITGTTGAFRPNDTGIYEGNFPTFADATHFYTYDNATTGAEFYRWTVNANGVLLIDGTTVDGMGGFSGSFKLANGIVYGGNGGIINPVTTPPLQIATLSTFTSYGNGVEPDPATGLEFMVLQNSAGQFSYTLTRYNTSQYVGETALPLPAAQNGGELTYQMFRWGQDGLVLLAYDYNFGISPSTSQILLLRGPFVLPSELSSNAVPTITSLSPSSIALNSGNTTLTINGSNFLPGAVALWGGQPRSTAYVDSGHLSVAIPAGDLTSPKTVSVTTQNPGSGSSNAASLKIQ